MNPYGITVDRIIPLSLEEAASADPVVEEVDQELFPFFEEEARAELKAIEEVLQAWDAAKVENPLKELSRRFHTLKGAANSIGHVRIGALAGGVKDSLEQINPDHVSGMRSPIIKTNILVIGTIRALLLETKAPTHNQVKKEQVGMAVQSILRLQEMETPLQRKE